MKSIGFIVLMVVIVAAAVAVTGSICGYCFDYSLWCIVGKDIPWYADAIAGIVTNGLVVTVAIACWIVRLCGVAVPFIG